VLLGLKFNWDERKAASNIKKHGVSFEEASTAFGDDLSITIGDPLHSDDEDRLILIGKSEKFDTLVVVHLEQTEDTIRIISARKATKKERNFYEG
jgi:uncharacterized DUF497 family protein